MKVCTKCREDKALEAFAKGQGWCKACRADYYRANREKCLAYAKQQAENPEYLARKYELAKAPHRRAKAREAEIAYAQRDPERYREKGNVQNHVNRAKAAGIATIERVSYAEVIRRGNGLCGICKEAVAAGEESLDHIIPLSKGGEHVYENCQLAHRRCNSSKGTR